MKIGLFGGSFDPPHRGHIALARLAIERLGLDRVLFAPVAVQPFKGDETSPYGDRVAMVRLAIANEPGMEVSMIDAPRADGRPNYTIDAIESLRRTLAPQDSLYCLMGADSFLTIAKWHRAYDLLLACDFAAASRPGFDLSKVAAALPGRISLAAEAAATADILVIGLRGENRRHSRLYLLPDLAEDISATEIRLQIRAGSGAAINPAVAAYIQDHCLYRDLD